MFFTIGHLLLCITIIGDFTSVGGAANKAQRSWEKFDAALASRTYSLNDLIFEAKRRGDFDALNDADKMVILYRVVIDRFTHSSGARHTVFSNWILFSLGSVVDPFGFIWDPEIMMQKGHSLVCSQSSYLLVFLALKNGIKARHVGLVGHVVMEAWYENDWHLFDPDAEVMPTDEQGNILSVIELSRDIVILKKEYPMSKGDFVSIIQSRENNSFISYPIGAYFEWKSQLLFYIEKIAESLKYIFSILLILLGLYFYRKFLKI